MVRERGAAGARCEQQRADRDVGLQDAVGLMKCQRLLTRQGAQIPYGTLYRFAAPPLYPRRPWFRCGFCCLVPSSLVVPREDTLTVVDDEALMLAERQ